MFLDTCKDNILRRIPIRAPPHRQPGYIPPTAGLHPTDSRATPHRQPGYTSPTAGLHLTDSQGPDL
ncbi:hypothetical protein K0E94_14175 [Bacteroides fragilis]|uniref:hypothetical protein n=1 Tax=Bacteroides TaxID=816 RepID=UPI001115F802|nr:hypothetical protein [Bacteroides fragilis]MCE8584202.1 hypothetical protein [Bacteroides fragilis]MCE8609493.1 hypothetical protein [Bacteroides fragilis]MCM0204732.1 hypothetical protein [Bacteroides fragilis]MCM0302018.1 hypothetical protein [Bacteroides fragilis]